jgi:three-Cys-motif partner protein
LFDQDDFVALREPRRLRATKGLVPDDEMLFSRCVSLHSAAKSAYARRYAEIVGTAMGSKWRLWWIELFAGPGRLYVRETGEFVPGSPIEAMRIRRPFDGYVFADLSKPCAESLRRRIGNTPSAHVLSGDANGVDVLDAIAGLVPRKALVVLYGDQEGLDLRWDTVKFFIDRYPHLDLLLNLPTTGVVRAVAAGYDTKAAALLGHSAPRELFTGSESKGASVRDWYHRRLAAEGFDKIEGRTVYLRGRRRELYDLLLASRHPLAPRFFNAAVELPNDEARWEATG